ncbi:hypothetical protein [Parachlamydia sp. AcF125]|uniref:hypothetical protein n=1 Tax=Parachlamydia sp. AcF125 TaxID=2795736 RepID=UPI001BC93A1B|nr:hypothetical protein [Parachlamydia sp. AcF125]MBS4168117.1 hypothetical protein [Parachlamydia sp. AcF125]
MPFQLHETRESFYSKVRQLTEISTDNSVFLNTKLETSSRQDSKVFRWLKWFISLLPKVHLVQTSPLKVAQEVAKFAEKHQKFLGKKDQADLIDVVKTLKIKCQRSVKEKQKKFDNRPLSKFTGLVPDYESLQSN